MERTEGTTGAGTVKDGGGLPTSRVVLCSLPKKGFSRTEIRRLFPFSKLAFLPASRLIKNVMAEGHLAPTRSQAGFAPEAAGARIVSDVSQRAERAAICASEASPKT